jgi:hypothetical protein
MKRSRFDIGVRIEETEETQQSRRTALVISGSLLLSRTPMYFRLMAKAWRSHGLIWNEGLQR